MNKLFKQFVAFAIVAVMLCGMIPMTAMAVEHDHDHGNQYSDIAPFSSSADLIEQVKAQLVKEGKLYDQKQEDEKLVAAVEGKSEYTFAEAKTMLGLGFFNNRTGAEGEIGTAHLNLSKNELTALVDDVLSTMNMTGIVSYEVVVSNGVASAVKFSLRDSFAAGLDDMNAEPAVAPELDKKVEDIIVVGTPVQEQNVVTSEKAFPFKDVPETHWARTAVNYLYQRNIVSGVSATSFGPNVKVSRAMAVTILYRVAGEPEYTTKNTFTDVKAGQWYTDAIIWASENGIVNGIGNNKFGPDNNLTREQLVTFVYRFAQFDGRDVSARADASKIKDANKISSWAKDAVLWAVAEGVIKGYTDGTVKPAGTATRAEFAQVIYNYMINAHDLTHVAAKAASCVAEGNIEYWVCAKCGKYFADAQGKKEITKAETVIAKDPNGHNFVPVAEVAPTCTETGVAAHYKCACGLILDAQGQPTTEEALILPAIGHTPGVDANGHYTDAVFNWSEPNGLIFDAQGNVSFDPAVYFVDENGAPILENNAPVNVGYSMGELAISSISLVYMQNAEGKYEIQMMPTMKPDYWYTWVDKDGDGQMDKDAIVPENMNHRDTFACDTVTFTCNGCGAKFTRDVELSNYIMSEAWIDQAVNDYATEIAMTLINDYVTAKAMEYYGQTGGAPSDEMINGWVAEAQADPAINGQITQAATAKAMELYQDMGSVVYVATCAGSDIATFSDSVNATKTQLQRNWATMCKFNEDYSKYFGLVAPYWESKNTETSPLGAVIYMCSMEEQDLVPNMYLDMMVSMLTQAFMSYVYSYAPMLDAMLADALAAVDYDALDDIDKLLLLHDWLASNATFDMQSLVDITSGASAGSDPISMTAFGLLLNDQIQKAPGAMWDGGVCLAYAATYAMLIQQAFEMEQDDAPIVDFAKIQYLTNVAQSSVAAGDSGFGDGEAMFNSAHYLNAVKLGDNWYYIDACYDDVNIEVISQYRVETDGNVSHNSFLLAPSTWEEMYEENFQYMDSLYDGKVWQRVFDGESGYYKMDGDRNLYTAAEAAALQEENPNMQLFYYYEAATTEDEVRYEDATYETAWFVSANSNINYDDATGYFYYTSGSITSYASMKDLFEDAEDGEGNSNVEMDQADMMSYKNQPSAQDKIVRRRVNATNVPVQNDEQYGMIQNSDPHVEVLFHFGYGSTGAQANEQYVADAENGSYMGGGITEENKGAYYDLTVDDAEYRNYYPELTHSTVVIDGTLYFNMGNAIYAFNKSISQLGKATIEALTDLELVKIKEYNDITFSSNGRRFTGMSFVTSETGTTVRYRPISALNVHDTRTWQYNEYGTPVARTASPTLFVSLATNLSNSYKDAEEKAYTIEARNFNPDYYRFMEVEEETEESKNDNTEFMWTANIVDKMDIADMLKDLRSGSTAKVTVKEYCGRDAFTETRTAKYGLTVGNDKTPVEGTAHKHDYVNDSDEGTNICSVCLKDHDHDYDYATRSDIDIIWSVSADETKLTAEAFIYCGSDEFCNTDQKVNCTVVDNGDGSFTATATYGNVTRVETKTVDQVLHRVHDYGTPVFTWTEVTEPVTDAETGEVIGSKIVGYTVTADFTCEAEEADCVGSDAEGPRVITTECEVTNATGEYVATVVGPDDVSYTDTIHTFSSEAAYVNVVMDEGKKTFTATYTCTACGAKVAVTGDVVKTVEAATCDAAGTITYTATAKADAILTGAEDKTFAALPEFVYIETEAVEAVGHNHVGTPAWNEDLTACTVTYVCSACGDTYIDEAVVIDRVVVPATCTTDGSITAKAEVRGEDGAVLDTVQTHTKTLPKTGHAMSTEPTVVWTYVNEDEMKCDITYTCTNGCGHSEKAALTHLTYNSDKSVWTATYEYGGKTGLTVTHEHLYEVHSCTCGRTSECVAGTPVEENKVDATCTVAGSYDSVTYCTICNKELNRQSVVIPVKDHTYGDLIAAKDAVHTQTELKAGVAAHYQCSVCHKYFTEAKVETTLEALTGAVPTHTYGDWVHDDAKHWKACSCGLKSQEADHDYTEATDLTCDTCGYEQEPVHVHTYVITGDPKWIFNEEVVCEVKGKCDCGDEVTAVASGNQIAEVTQASTCTTTGKTTYTATFTEAWVGTITAFENLALNPENHTNSDVWQKDDTKHWHNCPCGTKLDEAAHDYTSGTTCSVCGYAGQPQGGQDPENPGNGRTDPGHEGHTWIFQDDFVEWTYDETVDSHMGARALWACSCGLDSQLEEVEATRKVGHSWSATFRHGGTVIVNHEHTEGTRCYTCQYLCGEAG